MFKPELNLNIENLEQKKETGVTIYLENFFEGREKNEQEKRVMEYLTFLKETLMNEENYIDHGGAAKVYQMGQRSICVKIMKDRHVSPHAEMYDLGARPIEEFRFMEELHDFERGGIRSPVAEALLESGESVALVMEKLDAINLQHILNGQEEFPTGFDAENFFGSLDDYLNALHNEKGIVHMDLYPRNIMIDRETGQAYVIDFGRAKNVSHLPEHEKERQAKNDYDRYDEIYQQVENHIAGKETRHERIPTTHEVHHFSKHTKVVYSKELRKDAVRIAHDMLKNDESVSVLPFGSSKDLFISRESHELTGTHKIIVEGVPFYIGVKKD
jgi:tRNA A-37 threonylcarbamoyl transferase component Bud32